MAHAGMGLGSGCPGVSKRGRQTTMARNLCSWILLLALAGPAQASVVRGHLRVPRTAEAVVEGATRVVASGPEDAVVWVDSLPPRVMRRYAHRLPAIRILQTGWRFDPRVTAVVSGTTVRFVNRDPVYHNVFSISPAKKFDLGKYPPRAVNQVTFDRKGVVNLYCDIHPGMEAYVFVVPHRVFARPNRRGEFVLPELPGGRYELRAWHPTLGYLRHEIEVPVRGAIRVTLGY
jgi:hypothetical protein